MVRRLLAFRLLAAMLASIAAGGPLLSTAHLIAVQHVACEHGASVEVVAPHPDDASAAYDDGDEHRHPGDCIREAAAGHEHGHGHCTVPGHRHLRDVHAPDFATSVFARTRTLLTSTHATTTPQIAVLLQAPKNSPPA